MLFENKWANVLLVVAIAAVVTMVVVKSYKVLDANGKDTGNKLGFKATA
jgi:hypothetical protein